MRRLTEANQIALGLLLGAIAGGIIVYSIFRILIKVFVPLLVAVQ